MQSDAPFDAAFFGWMFEAVGAFWRDRYVPALFLQREQEERGAKRSRAVTVHMPADRFDAGALPRTAKGSVAGGGAADASQS